MSALSRRKFYKTTITYEILSEHELPRMSLTQIAEACIEGYCSGHFTETKIEELNGPQAAQALMAQGSDPAFFGLTSDGRESERES